MPLTQFHDDLWTAPSPLTVLGIIQLNTRMTVVRLSDGGLLLHSPIPWSQEINDAVSALGEIAYIVAPSCFHHMFVGDWKAQHPDAKICAPKGLIKKRPDLTIDHILQQDSNLWDSIEFFEVQGMPIVQEHLFFHKPSNTLIATDLFFYLPNSTGFTAFYAWINGVKSTVGTPLLFKYGIQDKEAFRHSLRKVRALEIDKLSLCHHIVLTSQAPKSLDSQSLDVRQADVSALMDAALKKFKV